MKLVTPKYTRALWGKDAEAGFSSITQFFKSKGFSAPSWKEKFSVIYWNDLTSSIRLMLSICRYDYDGTYAAFDGKAVISSKTIFQNALQSDSWNGASVRDKWFEGYVPVVVLELSHFKWRQFEGRRPGWVMCADAHFSDDVDSFLIDYEEYFASMFAALQSDEDLLKLVENLELQKNPPWVKSKIVFFGALEARKAALCRGIAVNQQRANEQRKEKSSPAVPRCI